jgi:glyoxylase-like metal-dependent hydrolase (beta-lactamase superfamily II)
VGVQAPSGRWLLINATPDIAEQLEALYDDSGPARLAAVVLTDAELDHSIGLLRLRESETPLTVVATPSVRRVLLRSGNAGPAAIVAQCSDTFEDPKPRSCLASTVEVADLSSLYVPPSTTAVDRGQWW